MSHNTVFSSPKASGGVHEQIESFLETVMRGVMSPRDQQAAAEQADKPGRPVVLPSLSLWMAVLVAVLRGLIPPCVLSNDSQMGKIRHGTNMLWIGLKLH